MAAAKAVVLAADLEGALARINARTFQTLAPSVASVSTITITSTLNVRKVCRDSVQIALSLVEGSGPLTASDPKPGKRKRESSGSVFFNQVTLRHGTKSIKLFNNGSMHITGCTSPTEFIEVSSAVCALMEYTAGIEGEDGPVSVQDFDIQMINMNFGAGRTLYLQALRDTCVSQGLSASYDPDTYPGLNVKLPIGERRVTVLLFKSGRVIVTGAKTAAELEEAHARITDVLDSMPL